MQLDRDAVEVINAFLTDLHGRVEREEASPATYRQRALYITEFLEHAANASGNHSLTAGELLQPDLAEAWLADAAAGKTRQRPGDHGPTAAYASHRARVSTFNVLARFAGAPFLLQNGRPQNPDTLTRGEAQNLINLLANNQPPSTKIPTWHRTAALAALAADTGRSVEELAVLETSALDLTQRQAHLLLEDETLPLLPATKVLLERWLATRQELVDALDGGEVTAVWVTTYPAQRGGITARPGAHPAAVRTLRAAHRALLKRLRGTNVRLGTLAAADPPGLPAAGRTGGETAGPR